MHFTKNLQSKGVFREDRDQCRVLHIIEWDNIERDGRLSDSLRNQRELNIPFGNRSG